MSASIKIPQKNGISGSNKNDFHEIENQKKENQNKITIKKIKKNLNKKKRERKKENPKNQLPECLRIKGYLGD